MRLAVALRPEEGASTALEPNGGGGSGLENGGAGGREPAASLQMWMVRLGVRVIGPSMICFL
jgi:hypothetical protein